MLKTNSKKVKEKIIQYLKDGWVDYFEENEKYLEGHSIEDWKSGILKVFNSEKPKYNIFKQLIYKNDFERFKDYLQGLPSVIDTLYYYNISAVDLVGDILEQTQEERKKYSEGQAEELMTKLLYNELFK